MINLISKRDIFYKTAGPKEKKRAGGINFDHVKNILSQDGSEIPREMIELGLKDESKLAITNEKLSWIESINLEEEAKKRVDAHETFLLIVGSALESNSLDEMRNKISTINSYLTADHELAPGSFGLNIADLSDVNKIKELFRAEYREAEEWVRKSKEKEESAKSGGYISNDVVYDFGDGWKVVYVPAAGEIKEFPGLNNTSYDRILEGDKNGLCLGSSMRYYQSNNEGEIYSIRDPGNNPRVTIRILENSLMEAKGKKNLPPDVLGATHANEWFETIEDLEYKHNYDYRKFPPYNINSAREAFLQDKASPYLEGWVSSWYKKGIKEIDDDVAKKVQEKDILLIESGLGKTHYELVKPTVIRWCNDYLTGGSKSIIFGSNYSPPTHEVFRTYRRLPEMIAAAKKLSEEDPNWFFAIGLQEFPEYKEFSDGPIKKYAENHPEDFIKNFAEKEWAKPYLDSCAKMLIIANPFLVLENSEKEWAKPYLNDCAKVVYERNSDFILENSEKEWAKPYVGNSISKHLSDNGGYVSLRYYDKDWAKPYIIEDVVLDFIEDDSFLFISKYSMKEWAKPFLDRALKRFIRSSPGEEEVLLIIKNFKDRFSEANLKDLKDYYIKRNYWSLLNDKSDDNVRSFFDKNDIVSAYDIIINYNPCVFFLIYSDESDELKDLLEDRVEIAIKNCISKTPGGVSELIREFSYGNYYKYIPFTLKEMVRKDEDSAVSALSLVGLTTNAKSFKAEYPEFADEVLEECANIHPKLIVSNYIKPDSIIDESYIDTAAINMIREDPLYVIIHAIFLNKNWAKKYLDFASKELINRNPKAAYEIFSNKEDLRQYNEEYANLAKRKMEEKTAFEKYPQLKKLSSALSYIGIKDIMSSIKY